MIWRPNPGLPADTHRAGIAYKEVSLPIVSADILNALFLGEGRQAAAATGPGWPARTGAAAGCRARLRNQAPLARISCRRKPAPVRRRSQRGSERTIRAEHPSNYRSAV